MNGVSLGFGIVFSFLTLLFCFFYFNNAMHASNLQKRGVITEAKILKKFEKTTTSSSNLDTTSNPRDRDVRSIYSYFVEYEFMTDTGQLISNTQNIGKEYQEFLEIGAYYDVIYDPEAPDISTIIDANGYERGIKTLTVILGIFAVLSFVSWLSYFRN